MGTWRGVVGLLAVLVVSSPVMLAQSDTEPPVLVDFDFNPKSIDTSSGTADVICSFESTDTVSGLHYARCSFKRDGSAYGCFAYTPVTGDPNNGTYECTVTFPQYIEEGVWLASVTLQDEVGNEARYVWDQLQGMGLPTDLDVTSVSDTEPPVLVDFDFNPKSIDTSSGTADVICSFESTDTVSGLHYARCSFKRDGSAYGCFAYTPVTGDPNNGTYECTVTFPQYIEEGVWLASVTLQDEVGNEARYVWDQLQGLGLPTDLDVTSVSDTEPPLLVDFDFNPKSIDTSSGTADVICSFESTDTVSGLHYARCSFKRDGSAYGCFAYTPVTGDPNNGTYECTVTFPQYIEEGVWLASVTLQDEVGNEARYVWDQLQEMTLPTDLVVGFVGGSPVAVMLASLDGKIVRGNSVTVRARLVRGSPDIISSTLGVRFDYRALPFGDFAPIPARNPNHPNSDTNYPYFVHWDVSAVPDGDYELRAVAHDLAGTPDPAPETITITIDHAGPADVEEFVNAEGRQENQTTVDSASEGKIASGDHTVASTATDLTLPPGSLLYTTDTAKLVYPDPADEEVQLEQIEQSIDAFVDLSLLSGQTDLEAGQLGDLNISYPDANQDGVVDGTSIREVDLELRHLDTGPNSYVVVPSIILTEHNMVHAEPGFLGKFALTGPLMPRMWVEADKETLTWEAVSTATSYVVYRGQLSALIDADADGLPDSGFGDCASHLDGDPTDLLFVDPDDPTAGDGFYYLVGFVGPDGTAGLGNTSTGLRREPSVACP